VALDDFVTQQVLTALEPAALELSLEAAKHLEQERTELDHLWQQRLERASFEAERAGRHYRLVEPENRMVARQLAREWEEKLAAKQQLLEDYQRFCHQQPRLLSKAEQAAIRQLAESIPALWFATTTTNAQRKEIVRQMVSRILVNVEGESERVQITLEWVGGAQTQDMMIRPVAKLSQLSYYPQLCERIRQLADLGLRAPAIAQQLNSEGFRPAKHYPQFSRQGVADLMRRLGLRHKRSYEPVGDGLGEAEWWLPELARTLGMPTITLYAWVQRGLVQARQQTQPQGRWIVWADAAELERLRRYRQRSLSCEGRQHWLGEDPPIAANNLSQQKTRN
jgi:hypothetical protein